MILVDTSIWIDHLHHGDPAMAEFLSEGIVLVHSFVIGEIALGSLRDRVEILRRLAVLDFFDPG